jgi:hypothetical protein
VERELVQAQRQNKTIIPCFHRDISINELKWNLGSLQGIEFDDKYELARKLSSKVSRIRREPLLESKVNPRANETSGSTGEPSQYISKPTHQKDPSVLRKRSRRKKLALALLVLLITAVAIAFVIGISAPREPDEQESAHPFIGAWGSEGNGDGEFGHPMGIAIDSSDNVYVADWNNDRIQKFDNNGNFITSWGSDGTDAGEFSGPQGIAVDSSDNVYVADTLNDRIQKFDNNGNFIRTWGSYGTSNGQFDGPDGIALDSSDNVYVSDYWNDRIQVFAPKT